jgi:hypothetical protein
MLWKSITSGLGMFLFWQTYVVAIAMTVIVVFPKLFLAMLRDRRMYGETPVTPKLIGYLVQHHWMDGFSTLKDRAFKGQFAGGKLTLIAIGIAEFVGGYVAILTLLPLMLRTGTDAAWASPWALPVHDPTAFFKIAGSFLAAIVTVGLVPIVGEMLLHPLMIAIAVYTLNLSSTGLVPGFWLACGIVLSGVAIKYGVILLGSLVGIVVPTERMFSKGVRRMSFAMFCLLPALNLVPAFIYAGWLIQHG